MPAAVLREYKQPLDIVEFENDPVGPGYALVRMVASGVCHSDLSLQQGVIPVPMPQILGHEGSGIVEEVGDGVTLVKPGDHVVLAWQAPCRVCQVCMAGHPESCVDSVMQKVPPTCTVGGAPMPRMNAIGTFSTSSVIHEQMLVPIDPAFDMEVAALVGCAVTTGVGAAINTAKVRPGETVTVIGAGGVGLSAIQGARLSGARKIVVVDRLEQKLELAKKHGATDAVLADDNAANHVKEIAGGLGTDHAIDCVGLPTTIKLASDCARPAGRVTIVGIGPVGAAIPLTVADLFGAKEMKFSIYGGADTRRDFPRLLELDAQGKLDLKSLIANRIGLEEVNEALQELHAPTEARTVINY